MAGHEVHYPGSLAMNVVDLCGLQGASFGRWNDAAAETTTIDNPAGFIYRKLLFRDDRMCGAIFAGARQRPGQCSPTSAWSRA